MSGKISGMVWDLDLPHSDMLVLLAMVDHADHLGRNIRPSIGLIAWKTGYSERQVQRVIKGLVEQGLLVVERAELGEVVHYRANLSAGRLKTEYKPKKERRGEGCQNVTGDTAMSEGGVTQLCHGGGDTAMSYKPSSKPSVKPPPCNPVQNPDQDAASAAGGGGKQSYQRTDTDRWLETACGATVAAARQSVAHLPLAAVQRAWADYRRKNPTGRVGGFIKDLQANPPTAQDAAPYVSDFDRYGQQIAELEQSLASMADRWERGQIRSRIGELRTLQERARPARSA